MSEGNRPGLDRVREAMRGRDEREQLEEQTPQKREGAGEPPDEHADGDDGEDDGPGS